ncbi:DUF4915 domain-containing protein [Trinickia fusca]|uniref:DUF4915 domain-containing protein n=1 Tax=Trinickia fusca TaxID=2419777 RepID=A0A494X4F6_9BURK|nr:DUF4915 domain-containing protein [Trinickia fusca]RKP44551.1 DUF4915 domain-containing protein [Trinickia fusca]
MTRLLISFRVASPPGHALAQLDTDTEAFEWIDLGDPQLKIYGAMGLCRDGERYLTVFQARREGQPVNCIGELDANLRLTRLAPLRRVKDGHSIVMHDGALLVVSSGTNQVIRVDWPRHGEPKESVFFEIEPGADTLHMNSLQYFDGRLHLSMFGPRGDALWRDASQGRVIRIDDGAVIGDGLYHPHALFVDGDALLCVGSMTSSVHRLSGLAPDAYDALSAGADAASPALRGYLRGAAADDDAIYIGTSAGRTHSRANGVALGTAPELTHGIDCGVYVVDKATRAIRWIDLSPFAAEIYDVLPIPADTPMRGDRSAAMQQRLRALNAYTPEMRHHAVQADQYCREFNGVIRELIDERNDYCTASRILQRLLSRAGRPRPHWQFDYATCLLETGNAKGALDHYRRALAEGHPREPVRVAVARAVAAVGSINVDDDLRELIGIGNEPARTRGISSTRQAGGSIDRTVATPADTARPPVNAQARAKAMLAQLREKTQQNGTSRTAKAATAGTASNTSST